MFAEIVEALRSHSVGLTVKVCAWCVVLFLLVGLPLAWYGSGRRNFFRRAVSFLVTLPLVFPPVALGFILLMLLGRNGAIGGRLEALFGDGGRIVFSTTGLILAAFIAGLPLVVRPLEAAMKRVELRRLQEAARTLGCGPVKTFFLVTVPQVRMTLLSGLLLGLARASGEVGISLMLGGNIVGKTNTLSLEIFTSVSQGEFERAMALCVILAVAGLAIYIALEIISPEEV